LFKALIKDYQKTVKKVALEKKPTPKKPALNKETKIWWA
jgi:hypothetical protein